MSTAGSLLAHAHRALPVVDGEVRLSGLQAPVEVIRDRWGTPHIYAGSVRDAYFAQGFVTSSDRLFQIEFSTRVGTGRLAAWIGEAGLPADRRMHQLGLLEAGARATSDPGDLSRELAHAYAAGVRAWVEVMPARPVEYELLDLDPNPPSPDEAETMLALAWYTTSVTAHNWSFELVRTLIAQRVGWEAMRSIFPLVATNATVVAPGKRGGAELPPFAALDPSALDPAAGSNSWVVSGRRSASGKPLLANDPHQPFTTPSIFYDCHLTAPGLDVRGAHIPMLPGIIIGQTPTTAWAITAAMGDDKDLYLERLSPDGTAALYQGSWEPIRVRTVEIEVAGRAPEQVDVRETRHGPLLDASMPDAAVIGQLQLGDNEAFAMRWAGAHDAHFEVDLLHRLATATDFGQFREALRGWTANETNMLFADAAGNIGYQMTGRWPIRRNGDGSVPVPGWTGNHEWCGMVPFEELPWSMNPEAGFLVTANSCPYDESYPHNLGRDFRPPWRANRISDLLTATQRHSIDTYADIQQDTVSLLAHELLPILTSVTAGDERQERALALLRGWDGGLAVESAAAALYETWLRRIAIRMMSPSLGEDVATSLVVTIAAGIVGLLRRPSEIWFGADGTTARDDLLRLALNDARIDLEERFGADETTWRWGQLHRVAMAWRPPTAEKLAPDVAAWFTAADEELAGDFTTVSPGSFDPSVSFNVVAGATWRQIVDLSDPDGSIGVGSHGQSMNPASPHWSDQATLRFTNQYHPLPMSRAAVERSAAATLWCRPADPPTQAAPVATAAATPHLTDGVEA